MKFFEFIFFLKGGLFLFGFWGILFIFNKWNIIYSKYDIEIFCVAVLYMYCVIYIIGGILFVFICVVLIITVIIVERLIYNVYLNILFFINLF